MTAPTITLTVVDGGLGNTGSDTDRLVMVCGPSSAGTNATIGYYTDPATLIADYGYGPGVSEAVYVMGVAGKGVLFGKVKTNTSGSCGAITHTGTGSATTAATGTPVDAFSYLITITKGGEINTGVCRASVSIDGGVTTLGTYTIPTAGTIVVPHTGVTFTFTAGSGADLVADDTYAFDCYPPTTIEADLETTLAALPGYGTTHPTLVPTMIADSALYNVDEQEGARTGANVTALQSALTTLANGKIYVRAFTSARPQDTGESAIAWATAISADFAAVSAIRVDVGAGYVGLYDPIWKAYISRPCSWVDVARCAANKVHIDPAWVALGPLPGVISVTHDERVSAGLDDARFTTTTTLVGQTGYFITNSRLMAPPGSDYVFTPYGRVMDKICRVTYAYFVKALSQAVALNVSTGFIRESEAQQLEGGNNAQLRAQVIADGNVSSATTIVSRTDNLAVPNATVHVQVAAVPVGYLKNISIDLFFVNPAAAA